MANYLASPMGIQDQNALSRKLGVLPNGQRVSQEEEQAYWDEMHRKFAEEVMGLAARPAPTRASMRELLARQSQPLPQMPVPMMQYPAVQGFADQYPIAQREASPRVGDYYGGQMTSGPRLSVRDIFNQAYAAAKAKKLKQFSWTNPTTGQTQLYSVD